MFVNIPLKPEGDDFPLGLFLELTERNVEKRPRHTGSNVSELHGRPARIVQKASPCLCGVPYDGGLALGLAVLKKKILVVPTTTQSLND